MSNTNFGFEELELWKKARIFKNDIRDLVKCFPAEKKYKLIDQIVRSSRSVNAQFAEGHGRFTYPGQINFCVQARGSLSETMNHLLDAFDESYLSEESLYEFRLKAKEIERMLNGYILYLRNKRDEKK